MQLYHNRALCGNSYEIAKVWNTSARDGLLRLAAALVISAAARYIVSTFATYFLDFCIVRGSYAVLRIFKSYCGSILVAVYFVPWQ